MICQLELLVPTRNADGEIHDVPTCFYAQLQYVIHAKLPADNRFGLHQDYEALLALVNICDGKGDATQGPVWYKRLKSRSFVHVGTIQCLVGRIRVGNRWGIIDTSLHCMRTSFVSADDEDDDED